MTMNHVMSRKQILRTALLTLTVQSETRQNGHAGHDATETNQTVDLHDQPAPSLRRSTRIRQPPDSSVLEIMCLINVFCALINVCRT